MSRVREAFLASYDAVRPLVASDDLRRKWDDESCLEGFSVRGLAGHLVRAGMAPLDYLEAGTTVEAPVPAPQYYATVLGRMDRAEHAEVVSRGEAVGGTSADELLADYDETKARQAEIIPGVPPDRVISVYMDVPLRFDDYLVVRIVEILVHTDDLAVSLGFPEIEPPKEAVDLAIEHLIAVARLQQGDRAVLIALSRRERDTVDALRVFRAVPKD